MMTPPGANVDSASLTNQRFFNEVLSVTFEGVLARPTKRHQLNDFLGFGLSMQNRALEQPLVLFGWQEFDCSSFVGWAREKVMPYVRHGHGVREQVDIQWIFEKFVEVFSRVAPDYGIEEKNTGLFKLHYLTIQTILTRMGIGNARCPNDSYLLKPWLERWGNLNHLIELLIEICDDANESDWPRELPTKAPDHLEPLQRLRSEIQSDLMGS